MREQAYRCDIEKACLKRLSTICCKMLKTLIYKLFHPKTSTPKTYICHSIFNSQIWIKTTAN